MKTLKDVMAYCESRSGVKLVGGFFVPNGGAGLYGLEQACQNAGDHKEAEGYARQRGELQLLMFMLNEGSRQ